VIRQRVFVFQNSLFAAHTQAPLCGKAGAACGLKIDEMDGILELREGCAKTVDIDKLYREPWLPNRYFFFPLARMA
jgi:hypothetical protein